MDEHFAPFVVDYAEHLAKLQYLAIKYRQQSGRDPLEMLNDPSLLTQLRSLKVEASGHVRGLAGLLYFPKLLTSLCIGGWGDDKLIVDLPCPDSWWRRESECLRRLAHLAVHNCRVRTPVGSIANLQRLTSLSFNHSTVGRDFDAVLKLTNLASLDLTGVKIAGFSILDDEERQLQPWSSFEAWLALHVFKFADCQLIDNSTELDIAAVQEVHMSRLASGMETASIHLFLWRIMLGSLASLLSPGWSTHIVDLHVVVSDGTALHLATIVNQVLEALLCLQSFQLSGGYHEGRQADNIDYGRGTIVLGDGYSGQLRNLQLQDMHCSTLDLEVATCLTRISLKSIENQGVSCEPILPSSVVRLEFFGNGLTTRHAKCLLEGLPSLTHVTLGVNKFGHWREPDLKDSACMPTMPSSLRWLSVMSSSLKKLLDESAQECLRRCTDLEQLMLPLLQYPKEQLESWVKDAQHVRVSDNDTEEFLRWPYESTFLYHI